MIESIVWIVVGLAWLALCAFNIRHAIRDCRDRAGCKECDGLSSALMRMAPCWKCGRGTDAGARRHREGK